MRRARRNRSRAHRPYEDVIAVTGVAHGGTCVGRLSSGKIIFIRHAIPGEHVRVRVTEELSKRAYGDVTEVLQPSPERQPHCWPLAEKADIGGVELGHLTPAGQAAWKDAVVDQTLRRIGGEEFSATVQPVREPLWQSRDVGARTRIRAVLDERGKPGMRRHHGHEVIGFDQIPLAAPPLDKVKYWPLPAGLTPGTEVRAGVSDGRIWCAPTGAGVPVTERVQVGEQEFTYQLDSDRFWQAHKDAPRLLSEAVCAAVAGATSVLELYSGVGLFTLPLAHLPGVRRVVSAEGDAPATAYAHANLAAAVHTGGAECIVTTEMVTGTSVRQLIGQYNPDAIVLDPPRAGAGIPVMQEIGASAASVVVLVSCDPAAMVRDGRALWDAGFTVDRLQPFDFFPATHHLETVLVARR